MRKTTTSLTAARTAITALAALPLLLFTTACTDNEIFSEGPTPEEQATAPDNAVTFTSYMGRAQQTRAGETGPIGTTELKKPGVGFGVFAYYTGTYSYGRAQSATYGGDKEGTEADKSLEANFMYNQKVTFDTGRGSEYVTGWTYAPIKYWPNEVTNGTGANGVDDQDDDKDNDNATTKYTNGGNLSFFAYAPYVQLPLTETTDGIIAINGTTLLTEGTNQGNAHKGDPTITYKMPTSSDKMVDLLWGTYGTTTDGVRTSENVNGGDTNKGVSYSSTGTNKYVNAILEHKGSTGYTLNADLTKQKTNGTVAFAFKHALAKVGGLTTSTSVTIPNGFLIVLDIDDQKGLETGGDKEDATKVTVKSISIESRSKVEVDDGGTKKKKYLKTNIFGTLDLATGQWDLKEATKTDNLTEDATEVTAKTTTEIKSAKESGTNMNPAIEEPANASSKTGKEFWDEVLTATGVLTTRQSVYKEDANPLLFLPGTYPELTVTVDYIVRTYDENLYGKYSEVEQEITKKVTFENAVELNKQYNLVMHLGLTSVKFTAEVSDWEVDGTYSGDPSTLTDVAVTDVYVPRNVQPTKTLTWSAGGSNTGDDAITVAGEETSVTINLGGLTASTTYTTAVTAGDGTLSTGTGFSTTTETSKMITLTMGANTSTTKKTHTFTVTNASSETYTITITQNAGKLLVKSNTTLVDASADDSGVSPTYEVYDAAGNKITTDLKFTSETGSWLTIASGDESTGKFTRTANTTTKIRTAKVNVSITGKDATGFVTITQKVGDLSASIVTSPSITKDGGFIKLFETVQIGSTNVSAGDAITILVNDGTNDITLVGKIDTAGEVQVNFPANTGGSAITWTIKSLTIDDAVKTFDSSNTVSQPNS